MLIYKILAEINKVKGEEPTYEELEQLTYLQAVLLKINEPPTHENPFLIACLLIHTHCQEDRLSHSTNQNFR